MFTNTISTAAAVLTFSLFVSADLNVGAGFVQVAKVPKVAVAGAGAAALVTINRHDVCVYAHADAFAKIEGLLGPKPTVAFADVCLCLGDIPGFIQADVAAGAASQILGEPTLGALVALLINQSPTKATCTIPAHSKHICVAGNPCGFECIDGYVNDNTCCTCPSPRVEIGGKCVVAPTSAPSKRRLQANTL